MQTPIRISKFIAQAGLCSRRTAEHWIQEGRVLCNDVCVKTPVTFIIPTRDRIKVNQRLIDPTPISLKLWAYHKPKGLLTTHSDPQKRPTVFEKLPKNLHHVLSVGRLDFNSEGLLLLTNQGKLARFLEHPQTGLKRHYKVRAFGVSPLQQKDWDRLTQNFVIQGVCYRNVRITLLHHQGANTWLRFRLQEGKNREIRRIIEHVGGRVNRLIRTSYGPFSLGSLKPGSIKEIFNQHLFELLQDKTSEAQNFGISSSNAQLNL